ncbi:GTP-binding protein [Candidimonas humi]|uniref:CobW family GTP-binding protein n=1 Tax=Candidimonas humi TaxID=683355 RepID=A0ABV8P027_9BURK|nr:GTP-binding protein [Candidimonas humi]MBV6304045.1 GTP-binding protein [Candidimonas humi]
MPVILLTGFLGSGKTTLLARWIHHPAFADTAVIINEFGEVGLDHVLLEKSDDRDVVLLDSGCLCCAMNSPLQDSLEDLYYRRLRGEIPAFQRVIVETSGLADPAPLVNTLAADPSVAAHYEFAGVVATMDAVHGLAALASYKEAATQLALADRVVVTKTDVAGAAQVQAVLEEVARRNPHARAVQSPGERPDDAASAAIEGLQAHALPAAQETPRPRSDRFSHLLRYGIGSFTLHTGQAVSWPQYARWVDAMQRTLGERLLRLKGTLVMEDGHVYAIHAVHHLFSPPKALPDDSVPPALRGALVVIARDLSAEDLEEIFALLAQEPSAAR